MKSLDSYIKKFNEDQAYVFDSIFYESIPGFKVANPHSPAAKPFSPKFALCIANFLNVHGRIGEIFTIRVIQSIRKLRRLKIIVVAKSPVAP